MRELVSLKPCWATLNFPSVVRTTALNQTRRDTQMQIFPILTIVFAYSQ